MRAVIYARYSSSMQREESIEAQTRACAEYIKQKGWVLTGEYIDRAFSARSDQRPEFQRMMEDARQKRFDVIVIHKLDRFSRDRYDHAFYKRELRQAGILLCSVSENLDDSPESVILEGILEAMSEYYSKNLGREVMKGLRETARACKHTGGVPPLGYDVQDGKYIINETEAAAVRYIFEAYADGEGYTAIMDSLKGLRGKRGGVIAKNSLHDILCNEKYTGMYVYNRSASKDAFGKRNGHANKADDDIVRIPGGMPAIISEDVWKKVRARMKTNRSGRHRAIEPYLLSGIIFCGKCGNLMTGSSRGVELKYYYECSGKKRLRECDAPGIERDLIENAVIDYLESLLTKETINGVAEWITDNAKLYRKQAASESKAVQKELTAVSKEVETIYNKIMSGLDSEFARQKLADAEARKLHLGIKLNGMMAVAESAHGVTKVDVKLYLSQLKGIRHKGRGEQQKLIALFISRVEVFPPENGDRQFKISTKLDKLLTNPRIEKAEVSLRHDYPLQMPLFIEHNVLLFGRKAIKKGSD